MNEGARPQVDHRHVAEEINAATNFTMYAVFKEHRTHADGRVSGSMGAAPGSVPEVLAALERIDGLVTRGWYDISGFRADADLLVWWYASTTDALQLAYRTLWEWSRGRLSPVWSNIGVHRAAEFNRGHVPAFLAGDAPKEFLCVYPFVRGRDWYLLPDADRGKMLREHGMAARDYGDVLANTVASFALGDYEWLLAFEADDLVRIVDLMRELRATEARRHVIEETPFFTGPRRSAELLLGRVIG
ncbi:hydrogen peroxide-dependent heme synthase [Leucobacter manosquensis]|uniref:Coproheme decarboxylase n=1 Tax=Leucobacter manosquensis TaxID=2810611 RepID=A0ABS5M2K4_9MICO|nr:hydrogen peroxide-dependent heme synthase [Leucobacter manosquensis]MBS3181190.1 chlorite dismutase family protein [Leucobacter manosquensis]